MKKISRLFVAAIVASCTFAACKSGPATISGEVNNYKGGSIECMLITDSAYIPDSLTISEDGSFVYSKDLPAGGEIWIVADDAKGYVRTYLKNGDKQHIVMSASADSVYGRCDVTFSGDTKASEYLQAFDKELGNPFKWSPEEAVKYNTFKEYKAALDAAAKTLDTQLQATGDKKFIAKEEKDLNNAVLLTAFNFARGKYHSGQPADTDKDFLEFVETIDYNNMESAKSHLIYMYIKWCQACHPDTISGPAAQYLTILKKRVSNQEVLDYMADNFMTGYMGGGADAYLQQTLEAYRQVTSDQGKVEKYKNMSKELTQLLPGNDAPDFAVNDVKGNSLKFSDIIGKGKVVYMDVWATWCGPCCAEIPHMEKLAKHYAGNSKIEIISISIDEKQDKWKKKLEADKPEWRQFIVPDGFKSGLCKEYKINGIPRFMLFDKDGKILNIDAPRPSDASIINYLDSQLK